MITKITILSNGVISPNKVIQLGRKYDNGLDTIQFFIPEEFATGFHYYLVFSMKKKPTILLPVNANKDGILEFIITSTVTVNPGMYEMLFLTTESEVVNGDIDNVKKVFVSTIMQGQVLDNPLKDPITNEKLDDNLQIIYESLYNLRDLVLKERNEGEYKGDVFVPNVDAEGNIDWTLTDAQEVEQPATQNIKGPQGIQGIQGIQGPYYEPSVDENCNLNWKGSQEDMPEVATVDLTNVVRESANKAVDAKFKWTWNPETKTLYIETEDLETIPEDSEGVEF